MSQTPILIILAGGASSRMWPLREKSLIRFGQEPLLTMQLKRYESLGFQEALLVGNPQNIAALRELAAQSGMRTQFAVQEQPLGMGDAILTTAPLLADRRDAALYITQVHDVTDSSLHEDMLKMYRSNPQGSYMAGVKMDEYFPGGYLLANEDGHISGIVEKPGPDKRPSPYVSIVAHIHAHAGTLYEAIQAQYDRGGDSDDHYERAMDALMRQKPFYMVGYSGRWDALKYPWHVLRVMEQFLSQIEGQQIAPGAFVSDKASVVGNVIIEDGAKLFPGAAVVGPAYIGSNVILGNNCLVREAMVLDGSAVGFTTEVARSYVGRNVGMHACRVLDSVFADNVNFSAGCTTANLRIDHGIVKSTVKGQRLESGRDKFGAVIGEDAFLGVDVMTMPGVKIGAQAVVGPGTHVYEDVPDRARLYVKQEQVLRRAGDEG